MSRLGGNSEGAGKDLMRRGERAFLGPDPLVTKVGGRRGSENTFEEISSGSLLLKLRPPGSRGIKKNGGTLGGGERWCGIWWIILKKGQRGSFREPWLNMFRSFIAVTSSVRIGGDKKRAKTFEGGNPAQGRLRGRASVRLHGRRRSEPGGRKAR